MSRTGMIAALAAGLMLAQSAVAQERRDEDLPVVKQITVKAKATATATFAEAPASVTVRSLDPAIAGASVKDGRVVVTGKKAGSTAIAVRGQTAAKRSFAWRYLVTVVDANGSRARQVFDHVRSLLEFELARAKQAESTFPARFAKALEPNALSGLASDRASLAADLAEIVKSFAAHEKGTLSEADFIRRAFDLDRLTIARAWRLDLLEAKLEVDGLQKEWNEKQNALEREAMGNPSRPDQGTNADLKSLEELQRTNARKLLEVYRDLDTRHQQLARALVRRWRSEVKEAMRLDALADALGIQGQKQADTELLYQQFQHQLARVAPDLIKRKVLGSSWAGVSSVLDGFCVDSGSEDRLVLGSTLWAALPKAPPTVRGMGWAFQSQSPDDAAKAPLPAPKPPAAIEGDPETALADPEPLPGVLAFGGGDEEDPGLPLPPFMGGEDENGLPLPEWMGGPGKGLPLPPQVTGKTPEPAASPTKSP